MNRRALEQTLAHHLYTRGPAILRGAALRLSHRTDANNIQATAAAILAAVRPGRSRTIPAAILTAAIVEAARISAYVHVLDPGIDGVCPECRVPLPARIYNTPAAPTGRPALNPPPVGAFQDDSDTVPAGHEPDELDLALMQWLDAEGGELL